ncbi:MAG TPA: hypothetical protein V6D11_33215 [Waterburya sp.]
MDINILRDAIALKTHLPGNGLGYSESLLVRESRAETYPHKILSKQYYVLLFLPSSDIPTPGNSASVA